MDSNQMMMDLLKSFPTLKQCGLEKWDPEEFDKWACGPVPGHGAFYAAQFVLSVYNCMAEWQCGAFNVVRSMASWDDAHREAFCKWANNPWFP